MSNFKRKSYTINLPLYLVNRLHCIKKLRKGKTDIGKELYKSIEKRVTEIEEKLNIDKDCWKNIKKCPACDSYLVVRNGKNSKFLGCFNFPKCRHTEPFFETKEKVSE